MGEQSYVAQDMDSRTDERLRLLMSSSILLHEFPSTLPSLLIPSPSSLFDAVIVLHASLLALIIIHFVYARTETVYGPSAYDGGFVPSKY